MYDKQSLRSLTDDELLRKLSELLRQSRRVEAELVAHIAEVDERRLFAREASPSMFAYCTEALHLSEAEAYLRSRRSRGSHPGRKARGNSVRTESRIYTVRSTGLSFHNLNP
jgi:hypothetical protein